MKILLVYTNQNDNSIMPAPIGLAFLSKPLKDNGYTVELLDLMCVRNGEDVLLSKIASFKPNVIGYSIRNLDNQEMLNPDSPLAFIKKLVSIGRNYGAITVLGGTAFTTFPKAMFNYMEADFGIAGQGEKSFTRLVKSVVNGNVDYSIPGLVWRDKTVTMANTFQFEGYVDTDVDWSILDLKRYRRSLLPVSVVVKTGCPYQCSYCDARASFGTQFVFRNIDKIIEDIKTVQKLYGINVFFLSDPCFNVPLGHAKEVLKAIIASDIKAFFVATFLPVKGHYDDEFFALCKRAGAHFLMMGNESFSETMLKSYNKPFTIENIADSCKIADRYGILYGVEVLFGGPNETETTIKESIDYLANIHNSVFFSGVGIRVLPDCQLTSDLKQQGLVKDNDDLLFPKFYISPQLDPAATNNLIKKSLRKYRKRSAKMLPYVLRTFIAKYFNKVI